MSKALTHQYVKDYIESVDGYILLSTEYINAQTKLELQCPKGHKYKVGFNSFQQDHRCPICSGKIKYTYHHVKNYIEQYEYKLLSMEYKGSNKKFILQCPNNHIFKTTFSRFKNNKIRCPYCAGNKKHTIQYVKDYIEQTGYKLLSTKYVNALIKLDMQCPEGHIFKMRYNDFQHGQRCSVCFGTHKHTFQYIKNQFSKEGYKLLSTEYINNKTKLNIQCPEEHKFKMCYGNFRIGQRCPQCLYINGKSKAEGEILDIVQSFTNHNILENDRTQIINPKTGRYLELDLWLPTLNKAIEYNGTWWHLNKYQQYKDQVKENQCLSKGIDLLVIEEQDWTKNKKKCINEIKEFINQ